MTNLREIKSKGWTIIIDAEDFDKVGKYKWLVTVRNGKPSRVSRTVYRDGKNKVIQIGPELIGTKAGLVVDHINGDVLDNRKANLRHATVQQNNMNREKPPHKRFKGCYLHKSGRWAAMIGLNAKRKALGEFESEVEAAAAYDVHANELFGKYAKLNFSIETSREIFRSTGKIMKDLRGLK